MTGRTHDLAAFSSLVLILSVSPLPHLSLATAAVAFGGNMVGGIAPDVDQPTADFWRKIPTGSILGRLIDPLLGGHRMISHSLLGLALAAFGLKYLLLHFLSTVLLVDMNIVWWATMIGYLSHLIMDTFTKEGVPWLFPIPIRFGIPPFKLLRITTGGLVEKFLVFPGLVILDGYLIYTHYGKYVDFLKHYIK